MASNQHQQPNFSEVDCKFRNTVIVTGFGPFGKHTTNASWEAVKILPTHNLAKELGINLVTEQMPVSYKDVGSKVPCIWKDYNPMLVIHVGVSDQARKITLEQIAYKYGYKKEDIFGNTPACNECCIGTNLEEQSRLDLEALCNEINCSPSSVEAALSRNAGRYLCEYIYYTSLSIDCSRALFVHVPPLDKPYSADQLAGGLADIIRCLVKKQLRNNTLS